MAGFLLDYPAGGDPMARTRRKLVQELTHQINSPLAAIRNALYLTSVRVSDPEVESYLKLADHEVSRIALVLARADQANENKAIYLCSMPSKKDDPAA
jgi:nitrogen-specific signal transduction histidine kinase